MLAAPDRGGRRGGADDQFDREQGLGGGAAVRAMIQSTTARAAVAPRSADGSRTVAQVKRLFMLVTRRLVREDHHLHWIWWRRRHSARARWFHHRTRLVAQLNSMINYKVRLPY
ncbi:MAG TPA: hypothetical protein VGL06_28960 [Pseudonocardiaceae bacterium]